jgi:hypothetical protein
MSKAHERILYRIPTRVKAIHQGLNNPGWFAHFEGSHESLFLGPEKPSDLKVGDPVFIDIVKPQPEAQSQ